MPLLKRRVFPQKISFKSPSKTFNENKFLMINESQDLRLYLFFILYFRLIIIHTKRFAF